MAQNIHVETYSSSNAGHAVARDPTEGHRINKPQHFDSLLSNASISRKQPMTPASFSFVPLEYQFQTNSLSLNRQKLHIPTENTITEQRLSSFQPQGLIDQKLCVMNSILQHGIPAVSD